MKKVSSPSPDFHELQEQVTNKITLIRQGMRDDDNAATEQYLLQNGPSAANPPKYDKNVSYYQEFWKLYLKNEILIKWIKQYSLSNQNMEEQISHLEEKIKLWTEAFESSGKKKVRRPAALIAKNYSCPFPHCEKVYGTDVSLNLHMKIKHNSGTKTEREALALEIILAEEKGELVEPTIVFPPGYLENLREIHKKSS